MSRDTGLKATQVRACMSLEVADVLQCVIMADTHIATGNLVACHGLFCVTKGAV